MITQCDKFICHNCDIYSPTAQVVLGKKMVYGQMTAPHTVGKHFHYKKTGRTKNQETKTTEGEGNCTSKHPIKIDVDFLHAVKTTAGPRAAQHWVLDVGNVWITTGLKAFIKPRGRLCSAASISLTRRSQSAVLVGRLQLRCGSPWPPITSGAIKQIWFKTTKQRWRNEKSRSVWNDPWSRRGLDLD